MPQAVYHFPRGFLWGAATAAHQVEGGNTNNNWSAWEEQPGHIKQGHRSGLACDWWGGRWKEDLDRAAETGQNAHRFSVEWSRVQPTPDHWDEHAIDYYREILRGMVSRGITPLVTLHHFTDPLWLMEQGGWENDETPGRFARFVEKVVEAFKEYATLWTTINEPNVYFYSGYVDGVFPPGKKDLKAAFHVLLNLVRGHTLAYRIIHTIQPEARVGFALNYRSFVPQTSWSPLDKFQARLRFSAYNESFSNALLTGHVRLPGHAARLRDAIGTQDYFGLNYYTRDLVAFDLRCPRQLFARSSYPPGAALSETGFLANVPAGLFEALRWARRFEVPIIITENGWEDSDDTNRPRYLVEHLHQVWRAVNYTWPIKGYFHWSLVDNFEWERGWTQRFGLWGLDVNTQARIRRPSVDLYAAICRENGISSEMVTRYAPQALPLLFPE
ncbi:MAG TPA: glycoside hydrolase family 1 protein [Anaerolineaceae bacterium]|jgi:beta-glucosidase|nr:glycoside hydrolase family 1 protein [Anaerolineaceae bacterium]